MTERIEDFIELAAPVPEKRCRLVKYDVPEVVCKVRVVVVYHVTIVAILHGLLKKFWPLVLGSVLRTAGSSII